jgi:peptidyl-prolyl cis-trans isomerase D
MFEFVAKHKRLIMIALCVLIIPPFALFGIDFYFRDRGAGGGIARVGKMAISEQEFGMALRQAQDRMREAVRNNPQMAAQLDSPQFREAVLNDLVQRKVVLGQAARSGMVVADGELRKTIGGIQAFRDESGKFSPQRYEQLLRAQGMTPAMFENQMRQDIQLARVQSTYAGTSLTPSAVAERLLKIYGQRREVSQVVFDPRQFRAGAKVADADAKKYYDEHAAEFELPERAKLEYVVLTPEAAAQSVKISDEDLHQVYQSKLNQFQTPEKRKGSHILFAVSGNASAEEKAKAKAQAEDVLRQLEKTPARFAELAKKFSQDPGSAEQGGSLGEFERGAMVKPFEEAAFAMKKGEIRGPVETQYGYHIIRIDDIKAPVTTPFEKVKAQLIEELRKERTQRAYTEAAQTFSDMVYEQYESLKPVADALKLTIMKSDWVSKGGGNMNPLFNDPKLLERVFSEDSIKSKRNTEAVEAQPNMLLSARIVEYAPASQVPFEDVKKDVMEHLAGMRAVEAAAKEGGAVLEKLKKGETPTLKWSAPAEVTLRSPQGLHQEALQAVFGADASKLPAYVGLATPDSRFVVYRISKVKETESIGEEEVKSTSRQLGQMLAQEEFSAFVSGLRERAEVKVDRAKLNPQQQ